MRKACLAAVVVAALLLAIGCERGGDGPPPPKPDIEKPKPPDKVEDAAGGCDKAEITEGVTAVRPPTGEEPSDGDMLVRRLSAEPDTLNPIVATDVYSRTIETLVHESLLDMDLNTGELLPFLAESWEVADDNVTFTFHLRKDVTFHDGRPMTADDFIYSLERVLDPKVDAASLRTYFVDCESYEKIDDYTVRIKWKKPYFKALEMVGDLAVVPKHILDDGQDFNKHPYARAPVGTGPYKFLEWKTGQSMTLERYEGYWGKRPHFDRIHFKIITNDDVSLSLLKKGELDLLGLTRIQWVKQTNSKSFEKKFHKVHYHYPFFSYVGWNMRKPMFADKRVRQAMTMLLDRELILEKVYYCLGSVATGTYDHKSPFSDPEIKPWPFDPDRAGALLDEAGWRDTDGDGVLDKDGADFRFTLSCTADSPQTEQIAVIYKEELRKAGIELVIKKLEWAAFLDSVHDLKFDACLLGWALDFNPDSYQLWHSSEADKKMSSNHVGFKNQEVDRLIELNRREFDRAKRIEYCRRIHHILHEEQPYTFMLNTEALIAVDKRVHNVVPHPIRPIFHYPQWYVPKDLRKRETAPGP